MPILGFKIRKPAALGQLLYQYTVEWQRQRDWPTLVGEDCDLLLEPPALYVRAFMPVESKAARSFVSVVAVKTSGACGRPFGLVE